jgi:hypothetical protein
MKAVVEIRMKAFLVFCGQQSTSKNQKAIELVIN